MPAWLLALLSVFAKPVIYWALVQLELKYPGIKPIVDQLLSWLKAQQAEGNEKAVEQLAAHVDKLCYGEVCPPALKN